MTSAAGNQVEATTRLSRRISLLPAVLGLIAVVILLAASRMTLNDEPAWPRSTALVAVMAVAVTVVSGYSVGVYLGLFLYAVASIGGQVDASVVGLALALVAMLVGHELVRISLDARRPARFAPWFWTRFALRTTALAAVLIALAYFTDRLQEASFPWWLVPIALAAPALPLLARRAVAGPADDRPSSRSNSTADRANGTADAETDVEAEVGSSRLLSVVWAAVGLLVVATASGAAVLGSVARSQIEGTTQATTIPDSSSAATPTTLPPPPAQEPSTAEPAVAILLFFVTMLVVGFIVLALRRREMTYELDEIDLDLDEGALGFDGLGQADLEDDEIEIDEGAIDDLLAELALDITSERDPGRAVRFAYANIERRLGDLGVDRTESETEQEFLARAMPSLGGHGEAMVILTSLFERARFGHAPVSETMRGRALEAVDELRITITVDTEETP